MAVKDSWMYIENMPLGIRGKAFQGDAYYTAENPPVAAVFTYYLKESLKTAKQKRMEMEKKLRKEGKTIEYPSFEQMRLEDNEEKPYLLFTITDASGKTVRKLTTNAGAGLKRIVWNFRYPTTTPVSLKSKDASNPFADGDVGYLALPGDYKVAMGKVEDGKYTELVAAQPFTVKLLNNATLAASDRKAVVAFQEKVSELRRMIAGANATHRDLANAVKYLKVAVRETPNAPYSLLADIESIENRLQQLSLQLNGDRSLARREFETAPSIRQRVELIVYGLWNSTAAPTTTQEQNYTIAAELFAPVLKEIKQIADTDLPKIEKQLEEMGAPYTPRRSLQWRY